VIPAYILWCGKVKRLIAENGMTQQEIADKALVSEMTIKKVISARGEVVASIIASISLALGIPDTEYRALAKDLRQTRRRNRSMITAHLAKHANCRVCRGSGEIGGESSEGARLCPGEVKGEEKVSKETKK
jgi:transcriptional regulator with XRE-family HTH domain